MFIFVKLKLKFFIIDFKEEWIKQSEELIIDLDL